MRRSPGCRSRSGSTPCSSRMVVYALLGTSRRSASARPPPWRSYRARSWALSCRAGTQRPMLAARATLTLLVGVVLLLASLLRLGFVANFISEPVLIGFKAGIGLVIVIDQVPEAARHPLSTRAGFLQNLRRHRADAAACRDADAVRSAPRCWSSCWASSGSPRARRRRWSPSRSASRSRACSALRQLGVETVGHIPQGLPSLLGTEPRSGRAALARRARHRPDELHRVHRRGARLRGSRRAAARAEPGAAGDGPRQRRRRLVQRHALGRRDLADGGEPTRRRPHPSGRPVDGDGCRWRPWCCSRR